MKVLFLTLTKINNIDDHGIYTDILRHFVDDGHEVLIVCPIERRYNIKTNLFKSNNISILNVWSLNFQKTNFIEKGISTLIIEILFFISIKKHFNINNIDLILYSTPPITFTNLIKYVKKKTNAISYLLLKDIFPQNAVDLKIIKKNSLLYKYFRNKEKELYEISDFIGCMSPANLNYILKHNPEINKEFVEVNPNSIFIDKTDNFIDKLTVLNKFKLPTNKIFYLFGGNLGLPQGIEYLKMNIRNCENIDEAYFIIVGNGTEFLNIKKWIKEYNIKNVSLINEIPKYEFDELLKIVDVGLIFLNPNFTIPNFPSRLLSYLQFKIPVICAVDSNTDIGIISEQNNFGFNCLTYDLETFHKCVVELLNFDLRKKMGENGYNFLCKEYSSVNSYHQIMIKSIK